MNEQINVSGEGVPAALAPATPAPVSAALAPSQVQAPVSAAPAPSSDATPTPSPSATLEEIDWADVWRALQVQRKAADDAAYWDERSKTFGSNDKPSDYAHEFLQLAGLLPGESVFDMGCGNGALALPLAAAGHPVLAADFSRGMLDRLEHDAAQASLGGIETKQVSWEDNWQAAGIMPKSCDVAFASRSIATADLKDSLLRLNAVAKRKCCITLATSYSPRCDQNILRAIGFEGLVGRDFWYAVNILMQQGILPEVRYIKSVRFDTYASRDEAWENMQLMLKSALRACSEHDAADAELRLRRWFEENLVEGEGAAGAAGASTGTLAGAAGASTSTLAGASANDAATPTYSFKQPRVVTWAFISWEAF